MVIEISASTKNRRAQNKIESINSLMSMPKGILVESLRTILGNYLALYFTFHF
ncbi:unnamed protein product [Brassica napus]|uniref:(rape) hypothetical protein n=1 Tax=Brassica napus TaxID=3708 RepID=A0A816MYG2_BRANA|nr:unnamed protein product [Brassica napus]